MTRVAALTSLMACLLASASGASAGSLPPDQACRVTKMLASGAELAARLQCEARHLASGGSAACVAMAAERRDAAFARVEARGACPTTGDSDALGLTVSFIVRDAVLSAIRPFGPTPSRCTKRQVALSGRAALRLVRIYAQDARHHDHARLVERLDRAQAEFIAAFERASAIRDCQFPYPALQFYASFANAVSSLRDATCPSCGVRCPCWSTALLDTMIPPGSFDAMGGASCDDGGSGNPVIGVASVDFCQVPNIADFPRLGVGIALDLNSCFVAGPDLDPGDTGLCQGVGTSRSLKPAETAVCVEELTRSQIYVNECGSAR